MHPWITSGSLTLLLIGAGQFPVPAAPAPPQKAAGAALPSYQEIFRLPLPANLPAHPRVFCTAADLRRIRTDLQAGDLYTRTCVETIRGEAEGILSRKNATAPEKPGPASFGEAAVLAQAYALTGEEAFGRRCRELLLHFADIAPRLQTTPAHGRFTESTLSEGPVAVNAAMAYDLIANASFLTAPERQHIERDLLRVLAWECGHQCHHMNSSNWRTWALAIVASCGFAGGDRELIEEAVNGIYDPERQAYLYGAVQTLTHSIFSDGIHWERSLGYTYYTASALMYVMAAARNSGIDLWHARMPGLLGPFAGSADHEEYGPAGDRSIRAFLDTPFYYAFPDGSFARGGDSSTGAIAYHPIYDLAYQEFRDPRYAWLITRQRQERTGGGAPAGWSLWRPNGQPEGALSKGEGRDGKIAYRLRCARGDRAALVQEVSVPAGQPVRISGWAKAIRMEGGSAHLRGNLGDESIYTNRVRVTGDWQPVRAEIPPLAGAREGETRRLRLHVFLEEGAGEVLWDDIRITAGAGPANLARNGSFETTTTDGRSIDFWSLVHSPREVPAGHYSLAEDAAIGISGRHRNGSTLFPIGGFAVLRGKPTDTNAAALNFTFGPIGSGHDHSDRLHFDLYGLGAVLGPDPGSWGYENPMQVSWARQTIAHNTLTVDETSQEPQGASASLFAGEKTGQRVFGVLRLFYPGKQFQAARATCGTAVPGVMMDRTLCLAGPYVLDVFRVRSDREHTYDLPFHGRGEVTTQAPLTALAQNPLTARGYAHLTALRRGTLPAGLFRAAFREGERALQLLQIHPEGGEMILAKDPARSNEVTSTCISRRRGKETVFVTVLEPYAGAPTVRSLSATETPEALAVTVEHAGGKDIFSLETALDGAVRVRRADPSGQTVFTETALGGRYILGVDILAGFDRIVPKEDNLAPVSK